MHTTTTAPALLNLTANTSVEELTQLDDDHEYKRYRYITVVPMILHLFNIFLLLKKNLLRRTAGNQLLLSLSISDLLLIIHFIYLGSFGEKSKPRALNLNDLLVSRIELTYNISILSTLGLSLDRYISVHI